MNTETKNQDGAADDKNNGGEGEEKLSISRQEYDSYKKMEADFGSLKRDFKDLKKTLETKPDETPKNQTDSSLMQKTYLRAAGITDAEEVELALSTAKKWGVEVDSLVDDEDFKAKLEKLRTSKANELATTGLKGGGSTSGAKNDPSYWMSLGRPPTRDEVPDRKTRAKIAREMMAKEKGSTGQFYND